jgi:hypothetical protein
MAAARYVRADFATISTTYGTLTQEATLAT